MFLLCEAALDLNCDETTLIESPSRCVVCDVSQVGPADVLTERRASSSTKLFPVAMRRARKSSETICPDRFCRPPQHDKHRGGKGWWVRKDGRVKSEHRYSERRVMRMKERRETKRAQLEKFSSSRVRPVWQKRNWSSTQRQRPLVDKLGHYIYLFFHADDWSLLEARSSGAWGQERRSPHHNVWGAI